ncbi:hypothetical protein XarbCFBP8150_21380 [Xanthomonas arboricola]|nr:hypothetical protein XarbCFBP8150_21380 [Xanthomonas arboricola]
MIGSAPRQSSGATGPPSAASKGAKRLKIDQAGSVLKIPTLPISWGDAQPLLAPTPGVSGSPG